mgnify:CR=1 FL=1
MKKRIGGVVLIAREFDEVELRRRIESAMDYVPSGRCLFILWEIKHQWEKSIPIESLAVNTILGSPTERTMSNWAFYGNGTVRLYESAKLSPSSTWMWVGARRSGEKAYVRQRSEKIDKQVVKLSTIPVSHPVFTRDVANNLWHLPSKNGLSRIISRLQSLTMWADEVLIVCEGGVISRRKHKTLDCDDDLVPVAEKISYDVPGMTLALPGKPKAKLLQKEKLF